MGAMTAHWPVGQPAGCHVSADGKTAWLNTSPQGTTPHEKYSLLCSTSMKLRNPDGDLEEEEEYGDKEGDEKKEGGEEEDEGEEKKEKKEKKDMKDNTEKKEEMRRGAV